MSFFLGVSAGSLAAGMISDRSGRRAAIVTMSLTVAFSGTLATAMPNVETFSAVWFVCGEGKIFFSKKRATFCFGFSFQDSEPRGLFPSVSSGALRPLWAS